MRIIDVKSSVFEASVLPCLCYEVTLGRTKFQEAILSVDGWLKSDEDKIVSRLFEDRPSTPENEEVGAKGTYFDNQFKEESYGTVLKTFIGKDELDYLENHRMADRKCDVKLKIVLNVKSIVSQATIFSAFTVTPQNTGSQKMIVETSRGKNEGQIIAYAYDPQFSPSSSNMWIISGNGKPVFLSLHEESLTRDVVISSSDWIHDYAPKFGLGEYFIVEIPKGNKTITNAWNYVDKAEESFRRWDLKGVYANCREVSSLLDGIIKDKFGEDSFSYKEKWDRTYNVFKRLSSLNLHVEDIKNAKHFPPEEVEIGKQEGEYLLYSTKLLVKYTEEMLQ